ncbi:hypothetical protein CONPUDRAFT_44262, partial [Coniophora puteana RWD-64-598 SS2]
MRERQDASDRRREILDAFTRRLSEQESAQYRARNAASHRDRRAADAGAGDDFSFPYLYDDALKESIIREWQLSFDETAMAMAACAVCAYSIPEVDLMTIPTARVPLQLLGNEFIPDELLPIAYDIGAYQRAILEPSGITPDGLRLCHSCSRSLLSHPPHQPKNALANFQYYARDRLPDDVRSSLSAASPVDRILIARAQASKIVHVYSHKQGSNSSRFPEEASQRYVKGNVAILPQDSVALRRLLPLGPDDIEQSICVLFSGSTAPVTRETLLRIRPLLASKSIVRTLLNFLIQNNQFYRESDIQYCEENVSNLFYPEHDHLNCAPLQSMDVCAIAGEDDVVSDDTFTVSHSSGREASTDDSVSSYYRNGDFVLPSVGYTIGDHSVGSRDKMKHLALGHILGGRVFLRSRVGTSFISEDEPSFLSLVFPHLDPWGIGGFNHPARSVSQRISFKQQVINLLRQHNSHFVKDPLFPFICWNVVQKRAVRQNTKFSVSGTSQLSLQRDLLDVAPSLTDLAIKWEKDPRAKPSTPLERKAASLLRRIQFVSTNIPGSSGYKLARRNEIRGLSRTFGSPALFVTINPYDLGSSVLATVSGIPRPLWRVMDSFEQAKHVADHPFHAALAFDMQILSFINTVLRYRQKGPGLFGRCIAFYGMVEAQGRGTLHCHMLIWLQGCPNPQALRDRMSSDPGFQLSVFRWIEHNIKYELPDQTSAADIIVSNNVQPPARERAEPDPRMHAAPDRRTLDNNSFAIDFIWFVTLLVIFCNWHDHTDTCYKYLKPGQRRDNSTCRMRIDGSTRPTTEIDPETGSILLRRLHPWINNYHPVVIFLLQCNMDIKFVGSGEAAKALVFYITEYVTKLDLQMHVGITALDYAVKKYEAKYLHDVVTPNPTRACNLMTKCVNSMMARQEMSQQQVMRYLCGSGDHYASHFFETVQLYEFDSALKRWEATNGIVTDENNVLDDQRATEDGDDVMHFSISQHEGVVVSNHVQDYQFRSQSSDYESLSLYRFASLPAVEDIISENNHEDLLNEPKCVRFSDAEHPQFLTHVMVKRQTASVPVLLSRDIPRRQGPVADEERCCRLVLLLFKPWRQFSDLRGNYESWVDAY